MLPIGLLFSLLGLAFACSPSTQMHDDGLLLTSEIDDFIQSIPVEWGAPGGVAVAAVMMNENGSWSVDTKGYGNARSDGTLVDSETMFAIGSNSKQFNAVSTGLLLFNDSLEPRLTMSTKLGSVFPESWELMDDFATSQSTIVDLFSHRTGLPRHDLSYSANDTVPDMMSRTKYLKPSLEFRDRYQYNKLNNIMYGMPFFPRKYPSRAMSNRTSLNRLG
ncbi:hypothetical protein BDZ89DRAFT_1044930 [Hymenopellis radicata]|nr:hypothetical protein BDZ89DRAFT_1044930 [Hymenopellis radicata]